MTASALLWRRRPLAWGDMDAWAKAQQPVSEPNFIDDAFKEVPEGVSFKQWQPVEGMLESLGRQLDNEDVNNNGGSSQGSQTGMDSYHRRVFSGGTSHVSATADAESIPRVTFVRERLASNACTAHV